jgi:hypothetical protein
MIEGSGRGLTSDTLYHSPGGRLVKDGDTSDRRLG